MSIQFTTFDYYRMEVATVSCPHCRSVRGERCKGKNVQYYMGTGHTDRKVVFQVWAKQNPKHYEQLRRQIILEKEAERQTSAELYMGEN